MERRVGRARGESEIPASPFRVETERCGYRFEECGFSCAIFAYEKSYGGVERYRVEAKENGQIERIIGKRVDLGAFQRDFRNVPPRSHRNLAALDENLGCRRMGPLECRSVRLFQIQMDVDLFQKGLRQFN